MAVDALTAAEYQAVRADAAQRLAELQAVEAVLRPDIDDAEVLSEWTTVVSQIDAATRALEGAVT